MEREKIKQLFYDICASSVLCKNLPSETITAYTRKMERDCYNKAIFDCTVDGIDRLWSEKKFRERYSTECYKVSSNIEAIISGLLANKLDPEKITSYSNFELNPDATRAEHDEINLRKNIKIDIKVSRMFVCPKCGKNETTLRVYQARSADEGDTTSIKCINCEFSWRKN